MMTQKSFQRAVSGSADLLRSVIADALVGFRSLHSAPASKPEISGIQRVASPAGDTEAIQHTAWRHRQAERKILT